jgi:hypothetical protein
MICVSSFSGGLAATFASASSTPTVNPKLFLAAFALASACEAQPAQPADAAPPTSPASSPSPPVVAAPEPSNLTPTPPPLPDPAAPDVEAGKPLNCPAPELTWQAEAGVGLTIRYCPQTNRVALDDASGTTYGFVYEPDFELRLADSSDGRCRQSVGVRRFLEHFVVYFTCAYGEELWVAEERVVLARRSTGLELQIVWSGKALTRIARDRCVYTSGYRLTCEDGRLRIMFEEDQSFRADPDHDPDHEEASDCPIRSSSKEAASLTDLCPPAQ